MINTLYNKSWPRLLKESSLCLYQLLQSIDWYTILVQARQAVTLTVSQDLVQVYLAASVYQMNWGYMTDLKSCVLCWSFQVFVFVGFTVSVVYLPCHSYESSTPFFPRVLETCPSISFTTDNVIPGTEGGGGAVGFFYHKEHDLLDQD